MVRKKRLTNVLLLVLVMSILVVVLYHLALYIIVTSAVDYVPNEGVWYCEDLQIQISHYDDVESYMIIDGQKIPCGLGNMHGSTHYVILSDAVDMEAYPPGELLLSGEVVELTDREMTVTDEETGKQYVFVRIDKQE